MSPLIGLRAIANHCDTVGYEGLVTVCLIRERSTMVLSVQKVDWASLSASNSLLKILSCLMEIVAADNSRQRVVIIFEGATRDFMQKKEQ